ncbi:ubiquitin-related modifier 1 [Amanita rubescens]|nr:ubiquitin-related modifier 1 [Amanita rubescens]
MSNSTISLKIEFGGGMELLFANKRSHNINIPAQVPIDNKTEPPPPDADTKPADITYLIHYLKDRLLKEREELFMEKGTVRPGILDWELEGEGGYKLKDRDEIVFISTLHGG